MSILAGILLLTTCVQAGEADFMWLEAELAKVREQRDALVVREQETMDIGLRPRPDADKR